MFSFDFYFKIDAIPPSDGCFSDVRGPFRTHNPQNIKKKWSVRKLLTAFLFVGKDVHKFIKPMFLYRSKYKESESDITNNDLLYKIDQQCQNTFD